VDVIFCQNVLIYFIPEDRVQIVKRLCQRLRPKGYLFLGPAEAMGLTVAEMEPVRLDDTLIYRRAR
jgi:chemotaxis protein methyltransferase CheR